jgi:hypothetical protein
MAEVCAVTVYDLHTLRLVRRFAHIVLAGQVCGLPFKGAIPETNDGEAVGRASRMYGYHVDSDAWS